MTLNDNGFDEVAFRAALESNLGCRGISLQRIQSNCVSLAYRATMPNGNVFFTKFAAVDSTKTIAFLEAVPPNTILPRPIKDGVFALGDGYVSSFEWQNSKPIPVERMNDAQFAAFCAAYEQLTTLLQLAPCVDRRVDGELLMSRIREYAARFSGFRFMIADLLSLKREDYTYPSDSREVIIHGDFHFGNFGFAGDAFVSFFDFDLLARGSKTDDLAFLVAERVKQAKLNRQELRKLAAKMNQLIAMLGRPASEWRIAFNLIRLRMADQLISRHPDRARTMWNVFRRDRRCRCLMRLMDDMF